MYNQQIESKELPKTPRRNSVFFFFFFYGQPFDSLLHFVRSSGSSQLYSCKQIKKKKRTKKREEKGVRGKKKEKRLLGDIKSKEKGQKAEHATTGGKKKKRRRSDVLNSVKNQLKKKTCCYKEKRTIEGEKRISVFKNRTSTCLFFSSFLSLLCRQSNKRREVKPHVIGEEGKEPGERKRDRRKEQQQPDLPLVTRLSVNAVRASKKKKKKQGTGSERKGLRNA